MSDALTVPLRESVEYGRRQLTRLVERLRKGEREFAEKGDQEAERRWRFAANFVEMQLLGDSGCVITPFDGRWLDDHFRQTMEAVFAGPESGGEYE